jgi:uncharacterized protein YkwD
MRRSISLLLVLTLPLVSFSLDHPYKRLSKLYASDSEKCLKVAERYINYFPGDPAPYYYAMTVYYDKAQVQPTTRKKYSELSKALSIARRYVKVADDSFNDRVGWEQQAEEMNVFTGELIEELKENKLRSQSTALASKRKTLKWKKVSLPEGDDLDNDVIAEVDEKSSEESINADGSVSTVSVKNRVANQYYGLPMGTEIVPSYSVSNEQEMLRLINEERKKKGMGALVWDEDLAKAARYHAYDMGTQKYFDHDSYDRSGEKLTDVGGTFVRIRKFYSNSFVNSENIAAGNESAQATYLQWFHSPGHYENMFNASSKKVGIGVVYSVDSPFGYYWVFDSAL